MACLWLATKVEEFNISIAQFVENLQQNPADAARSEDLILARVVKFQVQKITITTDKH